MDKKRLETTAAVVLVIIFIIVVGYVAKRFMPRRAANAAGGSVLMKPAAEKKGVREAAGKQNVEPELDWHRDPFTLNEISKETFDAATSLRLMGITTGRGGALKAIINNEIVAAGDRIGRYTVIKVLPGKAVVTDGEKDYDLMIQE